MAAPQSFDLLLWGKSLLRQVKDFKLLERGSCVDQKADDAALYLLLFATRQPSKQYEVYMVSLTLGLYAIPLTKLEFALRRVVGAVRRRGTAGLGT
jgi:hypothetical protein